MKPLGFSGLWWLLIVCAFDGGKPYCACLAGTIIDSPATWRYLDDGRDLGTAWTGILYDDTSWPTGRSPLGYGEPDLSTVIRTNAITTYYRSTFYIPNPAALSDLALYIRRDDGVRVFLNGAEIFRDNLSATARYDTLANLDVEAWPFYQAEAEPSLLRIGRNVLAAELHQARIFSSDAFFNCWLTTSSEFPQIVITAPQDQSAIRTGRDLRIESELTGENNPVERVEFLVGDILLGQDYESPYSVIWSNVPLGNFILRAVATSPGGSTFTSPDVRITAVTNLSPQGWITSPTNFQSLEEGTNILEAVGSDSDGNIALVEFYSDNIKIGEDDTAPFRVAWTNATAGVHLLTARFIDNEGAITNTPPINVRVLTGPVLLRGPYLQLGTTQSIVVRWRTLFQRNSEVRYGTNVTELDHGVCVSGSRTEHEVQLNGLMPGTKYFYSIAHSSGTLKEGADYFFRTHPAASQPTRIWVIGDSGMPSVQTRQVFARYRAYTGSRSTDLWLMLGDNAYNSGTDVEYHGAVFQMYPELLRQSVVWPTLGNHEMSPAYFDIFNLPRNGEAGGVPSGTENYYSFDYGNIHFVNLDGSFYSGSRSSNGPMWMWLEHDLAASTREWLIAYWHPPPYSKGSHDSDLEPELKEMRENFVPLLEAYGVDLVLSGHSHSYERSYLLRGHYGASSTLTEDMVLDRGSGDPNTDGAYLKAPDGQKANYGTVYVVLGSSSQIGGGFFNHPAMYRSYPRMGSLVLDIDGSRLDAKFLRESGAIDDQFTIQKGLFGPRIKKLQLENGSVTLIWVSVPGIGYQLQFANDLTQGNWQSVGPPIIAEARESRMVHVPPLSELAGFYRLVRLQGQD